jgi:hypothetical protein
MDDGRRTMDDGRRTINDDPVESGHRLWSMVHGQRVAEMALTAGIALAVYGLTVAPGLTWANFGADGGELITAAVTLGVPHPPGYPTYVLLGKLVSFIPVGEMAYRFNLFSAVCAALAAAAVTGTVTRPKPEGSSRPFGFNAPAVAAGLAVAFSPLVWSQAVITEVYGLNLAVVTLLLWGIIRRQSSIVHRPSSAIHRPSSIVHRPPSIVHRPSSAIHRPSSIVLGLLFGLSATTHLTSWLLLPLLLWALPRREWGRTAVGAVFGLTPLLTIPLLARSGSPVVWGDPTSLQGWLWLISGQLYHANLFALGGDEFWLRARAWLPELARQLTWLGPLLLIWSLWRPPAEWRKWQVGLGGTAVLYLLHAGVNGSQDAIIFLLPAIPLTVLLMRPAWERLGWLSLLVPLALVGLNFAEQNLQDENWVRPLVEQHLAELPPNAIVIVNGDEALFSLWYVQHVLGQRPDVIIVEENLFAFDWHRAHLQRQYPDLFVPDEYNLAIFIAQNKAFYLTISH